MCQAMWGADGRHSHYSNSLHWKTKLEERCERLYRDLRHNRHRGLHLPRRLAAVPRAFPLCLSSPSVLGQPIGLGLPHLWTFWFGEFHPSPKKARYVSCYSLKASDNIWWATTWALHSHPHPLALFSPDGNTQAHRNDCARRLLQPGSSAPTLLTPKPRTMSRLGDEKTTGKKQATTANTPAWGWVGKCQWPPASLCNPSDKRDPAVWTAPLLSWGPSWKRCFPKRTLKHWLLTWINFKIISELST